MKYSDKDTDDDINERKVKLYSIPGVTEVKFRDEFKRSTSSMKCLKCHKRPCICKFTL